MKVSTLARVDTLTKLAILADAAKYDASCAPPARASASAKRRLGNTEVIGICHSYTPDGRCVSLLKILLTNYCIYDCQYCVNRVSSDVAARAVHVEEVVALTLDFYRRNYIEGLFLSSGIIQHRRLHDGAAGRRRAHAARGPPVQRLHPSQDRPGGVAGADRPGGALRRSAERQHRAADASRPRRSSRRRRTCARHHDAMARSALRIDEAQASAKAKRAKPPHFAPAGQSTQMIVGADAARRAILDRSATSTAAPAPPRLLLRVQPDPDADERCRCTRRRSSASTGSTRRIG